MEDKILAALETEVANAANSVKSALEDVQGGAMFTAEISLGRVQGSLLNAANIIAEQRKKDRQ